MILAEHNRFCSLALKPGDIVVNENTHTFIVLMNSKNVVVMEPYCGNRKPIMFVYLGDIPSNSEE